MNTEIEKIVSEAMKRSTFMQYSKLASSESDCNGEVECLVKKHSNFERAEYEAYVLASTFNSIADYESELKILADKKENYEKNNSLESAITEFSKSTNGQKSDNAVRDIFEPVKISAKEGALLCLVLSYACLTLQWDSFAKLSSGNDVEKFKPDSRLGTHLVSAFESMKAQGSLEKWEALSAKETNGDSKLDFIKRTFMPHVK